MDCVSRVPETIQLYDRDGNQSILVGGDSVHFDPGSAGLNILESDGKTVRPAVTEDLIRTYRLTDSLPNFRSRRPPCLYRMFRAEYAIATGFI